MARLNARPSSILGTRARTFSPHHNDASDQENRDPKSRQIKNAKLRSMESSASPESGLPTPGSDVSDDLRKKAKRRRVEIQPKVTRGSLREDEAEGDEDERRFNRYYNPDQKQEERIHTTRESRALERQFNENRDEYLRDGGVQRLKETIVQADSVFKTIKQTNDATVDSRLLVNISDVAYKKTTQLVLGDTRTGLDVDIFLSKCISFMRNSRTVDNDEQSTSSRARRNGTNMRGESDDEDEGSPEDLDWEFLGRHACFPYNSRPPAPSFLLGPLSVQKKQRILTQRRTQRAAEGANGETRPVALTREDLSQSEENSLTTICSRIKDHLQKHIDRASRALERENMSNDEFNGARGKAFMEKYRVTITGGPSLFDYVVNPFSFGQTVENMFYVSFLIKEGHAGIAPDEDGLPTLQASNPRSLPEQRMANVQKHQAVFAIDQATWQELIKAFRIREPLIPHRQEETATQVGSSGWYT